MGEDRDGVILLMSMSDRKYATFFYGPKAEYAFDAYGQELMEEEFLDDFRDDDWYDGFSDYLEVCAEYLERAEAGDPVRGTILRRAAPTAAASGRRSSSAWASLRSSR